MMALDLTTIPLPAKIYPALNWAGVQSGRRRQVVRQGSAKPPSPVRIRPSPLNVHICVTTVCVTIVCITMGQPKGWPILFGWSQTRLSIPGKSQRMAVEEVLVALSRNVGRQSILNSPLLFPKYSDIRRICRCALSSW